MIVLFISLPFFKEHCVGLINTWSYYNSYWGCNDKLMYMSMWRYMMFINDNAFLQFWVKTFVIPTHRITFGNLGIYLPVL